MSGALIRRWRLAVLRVRLDLSASAPTVESRLDGYAGESDVTYWTRTDPLGDFGPKVSPTIPDRVVLPQALVEAVRSTMAEELKHETILWLRLQPPYGYLGAVPWENLSELIDIPVLRVPDHLPLPASLGRTWRVAMVVNAPRQALWGAKHVQEFTAALRSAFRHRDVTIDVFPDVRTHEQLMNGRKDQDDIVRIHDPNRAHLSHERAVSSRRRRPETRAASGMRPFEPNDPRLLWAEWIVDSLSGVAVRALHVAAPGIAGVDRAVLAIAADPALPMRGSLFEAVDSNDLWKLADVLGASLVSIAAPESRGIDVAARMVADSLGQLRPGPTLFSSLRRDPGSRALARAHAFFADPSAAQDFPSHPSWFGYVQPESVREVVGTPPLDQTGQQARETLAEAALSESPDAGLLARTFESVDEVPTWVASSSRFVETKFADLRNLSAPTREIASSRAYESGASSALADIQALVQRHTKGL
ncbi:hypothetical protein [Agromyces sp. NPDC058126]|uniref:hypothetical protein n=1 Tax=Agromyces sp. NPDC058126 TaxID=3346350 RepID=UPI0036DF6C06